MQLVLQIQRDPGRKSEVADAILGNVESLCSPRFRCSFKDGSRNASGLGKLEESFGSIHQCNLLCVLQAESERLVGGAGDTNHEPHHGVLGSNGNEDGPSVQLVAEAIRDGTSSRQRLLKPPSRGVVRAPKTVLRHRRQHSTRKVEQSDSASEERGFVVGVLEKYFFGPEGLVGQVDLLRPGGRAGQGREQARQQHGRRGQSPPMSNHVHEYRTNESCWRTSVWLAGEGESR